MSNLRLIIFAKIPGRAEPFSLDIMDNRSTNFVMEDILIITGLSSQDKPAQSYLLLHNGRKLDLSLKLSENGVKNGEILDLVVNFEHNQNTEPQYQYNDNYSQDMQHDGEDPPKKVINSGKQNMIGKKIDFD